MKKRGFTLVEMLIVVVIIWILASSILPRITGAMARARDTKRQADLRNIAAAINQYRMTYGTLPQRGGTWVWMTELWRGSLTKSAPGDFRSVLWFEEPLKSYLSPLPTDPIKTTVIELHYNFVHKVGRYQYFWGNGGQLHWTAMNPWDYWYQIFQKNGNLEGAAVLIAKAETDGLANYVRITTDTNLNGGTWWTNYWKKPWDEIFWHVRWWWREDIDNLHLCTSIEKVKKWEEKYEVKDDGTVECTYSTEDQLYYIVKIE